MGIADKLSEALSDHADSLKEGIEKVGDFIDSKTDGKFADKVDKVQDFLTEKLPDES
ncbi:MAG: antitoxin [Propionibacteriaceae bacterium]|nr:antitoxin [Propionibacteriaceae bacterium]